MFKKLRFAWFLIKAIFSTNLDEITTYEKSTTTGLRVRLSPAEQLKRFFEIYNVNREDVIDYTNTYEHHHTNFKHLDTGEQTRVLSIAGLLYNEDGKTPKNAAEVFDMTYEEYTKYKEKVLPLAGTKKITHNDIKRFMERERKVPKPELEKAEDGAPKPKRKRYRRKSTKPTEPSVGGIFAQ
jgi:hypothetical protein